MASRANNAAPAAAAAPPRPRPECTGCLQPVAFPYAKMGCDCYYCSDCLPTLVNVSLNGGNFPASCCRLPIDTKRLIVQALVGDELIQRHDRRVQEEEDAAAARRAARDNSEAVAVRAFARQQGWAECSRCGRIIERIHGCNHMTCPCSYQFCYACGKEWSNCPCRLQPFGAPILAPINAPNPPGRLPLPAQVHVQARIQARVQARIQARAQAHAEVFARVRAHVGARAGAHADNPIVIDLAGGNVDNEHQIINLDGTNEHQVINLDGANDPHDLFQRHMARALGERFQLPGERPDEAIARWL
ncbi:ATP-dependent RNA helicase-like protein [Apiospora marii]|uniref:ATP-dependent RNA helicase-like protein n=1 Tax=Apiospora marii TaxID=335849 RepID=A0ABR1RID5_9PEZI